MFPIKIYPYLSNRREINETDVKDVETCNLQKVWANINLYSVYNSNYQRRSFINKVKCHHRTWERGEVFLKEGLDLLAYEGTTFTLNLSS